jgi:methyltransferase (TIGR00027 family)
MFEVDHPATQSWKRQRLSAAAICIPAGLSFVAVYFERDELAQRLIAAGFDPREPAFFTWLGVVPYLAREAIWSTLAFIAALPGRAHVVLDYSDHPRTLAPGIRAAHEERARRVAGLGEPWVSFFEPAELHGRLGAMGFREIEDRTGTEIVCQYLSVARTAPSGGGAHVLHARTCSKLE